MSSVYVVQKNINLDYSDALKFGNLEFMFDREFVEYESEDIQEYINTRLWFFTPDDLVLATGDPILIGLVINWLLNKFKEINILKWDKRKFEYKKINLKLKG